MDVRGLDEGIHTMRVGGTRRVEVPPNLGVHGARIRPMPDPPAAAIAGTRAPPDDMAGKPGCCRFFSCVEPTSASGESSYRH